MHRRELQIKGFQETDLGQVEWVPNTFPLNPLAPEPYSLGEVDQHVGPIVLFFQIVHQDTKPCTLLFLRLYLGQKYCNLFNF